MRFTGGGVLQSFCTDGLVQGVAAGDHGYLGAFYRTYALDFAVLVNRVKARDLCGFRFVSL